MTAGVSTKLQQTRLSYIFRAHQVVSTRSLSRSAKSRLTTSTSTMSSIALTMNMRATSASRSAGVLSGRYDAFPEHSPTTRQLSLEMIRTPPPVSDRPYVPAKSPYPRHENGRSGLRPVPTQFTYSAVSSFGGSLTKHSASSFGFGVRPKEQRVKGIPGGWNGATVQSATGLTGYALKAYDVFGSPNATMRAHTPWAHGGVAELEDWSTRPGFGKRPEYLQNIPSKASLMAGNAPDGPEAEGDDEEEMDGADLGGVDAVDDGDGGGAAAAVFPRHVSQRSLASRGSAGQLSSRPSTANSTFLKPVMRMSFETIRLTEHPLLWKRALRQSTSIASHGMVSSAASLGAPLASSFGPYPCTYGLHPGFPLGTSRPVTPSRSGGSGSSTRRRLRPSSSPTRSHSGLSSRSSASSLGGARRAARVRESFPSTTRPRWQGSAKPYPQERAIGLPVGKARPGTLTEGW